MHTIFCQVPTVSHNPLCIPYSNLQRIGCTLTVWEGPSERLPAKVKNASGRLGIFIRKNDGQMLIESAQNSPDLQHYIM